MNEQFSLIKTQAANTVKVWFPCSCVLHPRRQHFRVRWKDCSDTGSFWRGRCNPHSWM